MNKTIVSISAICLALLIQAEETNTPPAEPIAPTNALVSLNLTNLAVTKIDDPHAIWFELDSTNHMAEAWIATNVVPVWAAVELVETPGPNNLLKQVGFLITNRSMMVLNAGQTNEMVLKILGREEWPTQHRTIIQPKAQPQPQQTRR